MKLINESYRLSCLLRRYFPCLLLRASAGDDTVIDYLTITVNLFAELTSEHRPLQNIVTGKLILFKRQIACCGLPVKIL